jgi:hypothetical protein
LPETDPPAKKLVLVVIDAMKPAMLERAVAISTARSGDSLAVRATIALGASGHRPIHDLFLGSTTERLLEVCPCPLFVHH